MKIVQMALLLFSLNIWAQNYPTEKVYVQTEKVNYQAGDTLRFSAFLWANNDNVASRVLYIELLSPSVFLVGERILKIEDKPVNHYFILDSTAKGNYTIRAYTQYLAGFGNDAFFQKQLQVGNEAAEKPTMGL